MNIMTCLLFLWSLKHKHFPVSSSSLKLSYATNLPNTQILHKLQNRITIEDMLYNIILNLFIVA